MTKTPIAITMGDPAGVGPELCLRLLDVPAARRDWTPIVLGDADVLAAVASCCPSLPRPDYAVITLEEFRAAPDKCTGPTVVQIGALTNVTPGQVSGETGAAAYRYIITAIELAQQRLVAGITTGPIHKEAIRAAGILHPGHTEILAEATGTPRYCMMLTSDEITCSFVTTHVGYHEVPGLLSVERIREVAELTDAALKKIGRETPRLLVCALNPHGGEHGLFGNSEEERIIEPAIETLQRQGINAVGPVVPDTAFLPERRATTDAYICMYHDQGHIPLKALAFDEAVNVTLGLPIVRTSVDHGTALDIAWRGQARVSSFLHAIQLAARLASPALTYVPTENRT